jgi:hypothetical protein
VQHDEFTPSGKRQYFVSDSEEDDDYKLPYQLAIKFQDPQDAVCQDLIEAIPDSLKLVT